MHTYYGRPRPDDYYCNYCVIGKFKLGGAPGCYDAGRNTACMSVHVYLHSTLNICIDTNLSTSGISSCFWGCVCMPLWVWVHVCVFGVGVWKIERN